MMGKINSLFSGVLLVMKPPKPLILLHTLQYLYTYIKKTTEKWKKNRVFRGSMVVHTLAYEPHDFCYSVSITLKWQP